MPKRNPDNQAGRIAFIHAIAHIKRNAVDLAWDIIEYFGAENIPRAF